MIDNKQKDPRWANIKLGTCSDTIGQSGCFISSLGDLCDKTPDIVNQLLKDNGGYTKGCLVDAVPTAKLLGLEYNGKSTIKPYYDTIAETNYFAPNYPQHFFIVKTDSSILDPLGKNIKYPIVSYRLFKAKGDFMKFETFNSNGDVYVRLWGNYLVHIPTPDEAEKYFGSNWLSDAKKVDDIHSVGTVVDEVVTSNDQCNKDKENLINGSKDKQNQIDTLTQTKNDLQKQLGEKLTEIIDLKKKVIECENKPKSDRGGFCGFLQAIKEWFNK